MRRPTTALLGAVPLLVTLAWLASPAGAQPAAPDSVAVSTPSAGPTSAGPDTTASKGPSVADTTAQTPKKTKPPGEDPDRWEFGVAWPEGYFNLLGTVDYRRLFRTRDPFQQILKIELTGSHLGYLTEGSLSLYYLFRPIKSYKQSWRLRPLVEVGPGAHLVLEAASIEGFSEYSYHTHVYVKMHGYFGAEFLATHKVGFLVCGRITLPDHQPFDYAQAAIFFR